MKTVARQISAEDDPAKACEVLVFGPNHTAMVIAAKREAARFLKEPFVNLVATHAGMATVAAHERFIPHLGVEARPVLWRMSVTVRLDPQIVKARREEIRAARGESPAPDEDEE